VPTRKQKPRKSKLASFAAPTGGLISNRNLALARGEGLPPGAAVLNNWFPTSTGIIIRRGHRRHATIDGDLPVASLFTYVSGEQQELFAATAEGIWNVTTVPNPFTYVLATDALDCIAVDPETEAVLGESSTEGLEEVENATGGEWITTQFTTAGGSFLIGVNGQDTGFIYDGETFFPYIAGGVSSLNFSGEVTPFVIGETVTGGHSGVTATVFRAISDGAVGTLHLTGITGSTQTGVMLADLSGPLAVGDVVSGDLSEAEMTVQAVVGDGRFLVNTVTDGPAREVINTSDDRSMYLTGLSGTFTDGTTLTGDLSGASASVLEIVGDGVFFVTAGSAGPDRDQLTLSAETAAFVVGEVVTGTTSGATMTVSARPGGMVLWGTSITGTFTPGEALTGSIAGAGTLGTYELLPFVAFIEGEGITATSGGTATLDTAPEAHVDFVDGEVVTGLASGATMTISALPDPGVLWGYSVTGTFLLGEPISGDVAGYGTMSSRETLAEVPFIEGEDITSGGVTGVLAAVPEDEEWTAFVEGEPITSAGGAAEVVAPQVLIIPGVTGVDTANLSFVWAYKERLYFIERETLNAWYLPVEQIGGEMSPLPLGGVFTRGGSLLWGQQWSLETSGDGGLSEQNVFVTTEGEVAAYQGLSPDEAATWTKVGVYRIGRPLGKKAFIRAGGDLVIATAIGFISLAQAVQRDFAALGSTAVSYPIEDAWARAVQDRGMTGWQCETWAEGNMVLVAPPTPDSMAPTLLVANSITGAWCVFTGWTVTSMEIFRSGLYFGGATGEVNQGSVGGSDNGAPFTAAMLHLFDDFDSGASRKYAKFARVTKRSAYPAIEGVAAKFDYNESLPSPPNAATIPTGNEWDNAIWDVSTWNAERGSIVTTDWKSVGGSGYAASVGVQVTSGASVPLDVEVIRTDLLYEEGGVLG